MTQRLPLMKNKKQISIIKSKKQKNNKKMIKIEKKLKNIKKCFKNIKVIF